MHNKIPEITKLIYPSNILYQCFSRLYWSLVIAPNGDCYKCWEDIGNNSFKMGNIKESGFLNSEIQLKYLYDSYPFDIIDCKKCNVLPVCINCPKDFLVKNNNSKCSIFKDNLDEYLKQYIKMKQEI